MNKIPAEYKTPVVLAPLVSGRWILSSVGTKPQSEIHLLFTKSPLLARHNFFSMLGQASFPAA